MPSPDSDHSYTGSSRSLWIPWAYTAAFLVIVAINGVMVWAALVTSPGEIIDAAWQRGRHYDQVIQAAREQASLGWTLQLSTSRPDGRYFRAAVAPGAIPTSLHLRAIDAYGLPLHGLAVRVRAVRPVAKLPPIDLSFISEGAGQYRADVALPLPGLWEIQLDASNPDGRYAMAQRINVR